MKYQDYLNINASKFQLDLIKLGEKIKNNGSLAGRNVIFYREEQQDYLYTNGYYIITIPEVEMWLDINQFNKYAYFGIIKNKNLDDILKNEPDDYEEAKVTGIERKDDKRTLIEIATGNVKAYVNKDFLKYFQISNCRFKIKNEISIVRIYDINNIRGCIGAICPVRIRKEDND